jgi:aspartate racemase
MAALAHRLINKSAQAVIAGCTEVPLVLSQTELSTPFLDATQTLAVRCVEVCLGD